MKKRSNQLVHETSPYLLQHAHNPVNWYPWGEEALSRARNENKPILVSIGYAACHWCHVMERESFENEQTAELMNEHFINIKIDREERPDLDHIYMDAVQAMTGSGGWPLNVFLTPDMKPFYGGTYFPPRRAFNRASWTEVLQGVVQAFTERRHEIDAQAENLTTHLLQSNAFGMQKQDVSGGFFFREKSDQVFDNIMKQADRDWGGFGKAPKFPQTFSIQYLLRYHHSKNSDRANSLNEMDGEALNQALLSLDKMIEGGIYDQLGGGFARYSTDTEWLAPHFEKMLYDNALLISVLSEAYQLTNKERYREVIEETLGFIEREMLHDQKGFYAALDADSEGEEGRFYVWQKQELEQLLGDDAELVCHYYDVSEKGNWEEKNILRVKQPLDEFARTHAMDIEVLKGKLNKARGILLSERNTRIRPLLDDKIILGWNALMNSACSKAYAVTGHETYRRLAIDNMNFLLTKFAVPGESSLRHTWKNGQAKYPAFLDDYAFLIDSLIQLQEITGDTNWLTRARDFTQFVIGSFSEPETGYFFYTPEGQQDIIVRKKEVYDGAVPSGNAVMAVNLHRLGILFDEQEWKDRSISMISSLGQAIVRYPTSFGCWACLLLEKIQGTAEIVIGGVEPDRLRGELLRKFIPNRVLMTVGKNNQGFPLLAGKLSGDSPVIYVCKNFVCLQPVESIDAVMSLINNAPTNN